MSSFHQHNLTAIEQQEQSCLLDSSAHLNEPVLIADRMQSALSDNLMLSELMMQEEQLAIDPDLLQLKPKPMDSV